MINCKFEDGVDVSLRHVTVGVVVEYDNKILLVQRSPDSYSEPNKWTIPGGFLDRDESAEEGAKRETMEEAGWNIEITGLLRVNSNPNRPKEDRQNVDIIFCGKGIKKSGAHDKEISNVQWFEKDKIPDASEFAFDHWDNVQLYINMPEFRAKN